MSYVLQDLTHSCPLKVLVIDVLSPAIPLCLIPWVLWRASSDITPNACSLLDNYAQSYSTGRFKYISLHVGEGDKVDVDKKKVFFNKITFNSKAHN